MVCNVPPDATVKNEERPERGEKGGGAWHPVEKKNSKELSLGARPSCTLLFYLISHNSGCETDVAIPLLRMTPEHANLHTRTHTYMCYLSGFQKVVQNSLL